MLDLIPPLMMGMIVGAAGWFLVLIAAFAAPKGARSVPEMLGGFDSVQAPIFMAGLAVLSLSAPHALLAIGRRFPPAPTRAALIQRRKARRTANRTLGSIGMVYVVALVAMSVWFRAWPPLAFFLGGNSAALGCACILLGTFGRRGVRLACARCSYPMETWRGSPEVCSECGTPWHEWWNVRFGERAVRWRLVWIGAAAVAFSMLCAASLAAWHSTQFP